MSHTPIIRPVAETLRVAGRIDFDEQRLARIGATVTGRVTQMQVNFTPEDRSVSFLPLSHVAAQVADIYVPMATLEEELKMLRLENAELKMERDMLKKAAAYFAKLQK